MMDINTACEKLGWPKDFDEAAENYEKMIAVAPVLQGVLSEAFDAIFEYDGTLPTKPVPTPDVKPDVIKVKRDKAAEKYPERIDAIIEEIKHLPNIEAEICGNWLWVSGDTKPKAATFKKVGLRWASKKEMWYWRPAGYRKKSKKVYDMDEIRHRFGSKKVVGDDD
jgi:hypothetical protein